MRNLPGVLCVAAVVAAPASALAARQQQAEVPFWQRFIAAVLPGVPQPAMVTGRHARHRHQHLAVARAALVVSAPPLEHVTPRHQVREDGIRSNQPGNLPMERESQALAPLQFEGAPASAPQAAPPQGPAAGSQVAPPQGPAAGSQAAPLTANAALASACLGGRRLVSSVYWEGRHTASGQPFNPHGMTAAHRTLPFGTRLQVTNPRTGQSVSVVINDRGPYVRGVSLDLSLGAAKAIGLHSNGTVCVL